MRLSAEVPLLLAALCSLCVVACVTVPPGQAALVTSSSGLEEPVGEGQHYVGPLAQVDLYDLRQQERNDTLEALTRDGEPIRAGASLVTYRLAPDELKALAREVGPDVYDVAVAPVVASTVRRVLGGLRVDELDTAHLRAAQEDITRDAAALLRPLHVILERVDLREVAPLGPAFVSEVSDTSAAEQRSLSTPDLIRLARGHAADLRAQAAGIAAANATIGPTLNPGALEENRTRAWRKLLTSHGVSVSIDEGPTSLEVSP